MENASKALIIAGAILISILIIGIGMAVINATTSVTDSTGAAMDKQQLETFNSEYTSYVGDNQRGSLVKTLVDKINANNATNEDYQIKLTVNASSYEGENVTDALSFISSTKRYKISVKTEKKSGRVNEVVVVDA